MLFGQAETRTVALGQLLFLRPCGHAVGDNRPNGMNDMPGRQIVASGDEGIARSQKPPLHDGGTLAAKLQAGSRMDTVVDTIVERRPTAQCLRIGRIDDGIDLQTSDVALPKQQPVIDCTMPDIGSLHIAQGDHALGFALQLQLGILLL